MESRIVNRKIEYADLIDVAREFGVSTQAMLYRMANMGLIPWEIADEAAKSEELTTLDRRKRKRGESSKPTSDRFIRLAVKCLRKGLISRGKFAEILEIEQGGWVMKSATIKRDIGKSVFLKSLVNVPELVTDRLTPGNWETNVLCRVDGSGGKFLVSIGPRWFGPEKGRSRTSPTTSPRRSTRDRS